MEADDRAGRLQAALWLAVGRIVDDVLGNSSGVNASTDFIAALTTAAWRYAETISVDSQLFARHRSSNTLETKDVLLVARRNIALVNMNLRSSALTVRPAKRSILGCGRFAKVAGTEPVPVHRSTPYVLQADSDGKIYAARGLYSDAGQTLDNEMG
ncbi:MHF histone-fold complex component [Savitreella phatthalungensis]